jgi:nitrate reductase NapE component
VWVSVKVKNMKPFKETKLGQFLKDKAPDVLDYVGDKLPDAGVLGIVKRIVSKKLSPEDQEQFNQIAADHEREMYALEVQDRDSARRREAEFAKVTGHSDYMVWFLSISLMVAFGFIVWHLVRDSVPNENRELVTNIVGIIEGLLISIYSYYFGSSMGSRLKDMGKK